LRGFAALLRRAAARLFYTPLKTKIGVYIVANSYKKRKIQS
jgi:hypothetical protein